MNRDEFLKSNGVVIEKVHIKEISADLFVRCLSAGERSTWEYDSMTVDNSSKQGSTIKLQKDRMITAKVRLVELALCNEDGTAFCKEGDVVALARMNANVIEKLYVVAARLSGVTKEDLEELGKNSGSEAAAVS